MENKRKILGTGILLITALIWGVGFPMQSMALEHVGAATLTCVRNVIAGLFLLVLIVIFDRVRESLRSRRRDATLADIVNESITDTLSRSIFTSLTTFFMVLALYIFGVASVKEFALPIMIGIICGAYSSVCLAGSIWYVMRKKADDAAQSSSGSKNSGKGGSGSGQQSKKKKDDYSNLSKRERKERRRREEEAKNRAKITV